MPYDVEKEGRVSLPGSGLACTQNAGKSSLLIPAKGWKTFPTFPG